MTTEAKIEVRKYENEINKSVNKIVDSLAGLDYRKARNILVRVNMEIEKRLIIQ